MKQLNVKLLMIMLILCFSGFYGKVEAVDANVADSLELVDFYNATDGTNWTNPWDLGQPVSSWLGVDLDSEGRVLDIFLPENNLQGIIPDINLPKLKSLYCTINNITEVSNFSHLSELEVLHIGANELTYLPVFSNLTKLENLNCSSNLLTNLPDFNLPKLKKLICSNNELTTLPNFNYLPELLEMKCGSNEINALPVFNNLQKLKYLYCGDNELITLPDFNLPQLLHIYSANNKLINLPDFTSLPELLRLDCSNNELVSSPPFSYSSKLRHVFCQNNKLVSMSNFVNLTSLVTLDCSNNLITGTIPNFNLPRLVTFDCSENQLVGAIPNFNGLPKLETLICSRNQLIGVIPDFNLPELIYLDCSRNQITDNIPNFSNLTNLIYLNCSRNQLTDSIPNFENLPMLRDLRCLGNKLTGSIPNFGNTPQLNTFLCYNNKLSGEIPDLSNSCPLLNRFHYRYNNFTFEDIIPSFLDNDYIGGLHYGQQNDFFQDTTINVTEGGSINIDLLIDENISTNIYEWYLNGNLINTVTGDNNLIIPSISLSDAGVYTCKVTNPAVPDLILESRNIMINITQPLSCTLNDSISLVAFYSATNGDNWTNSWNLNEPISTWHGVILNADGCVKKLELNNNNLTGILIDFNLPKLEVFDCSGNEIGGTLPNFSEVPNLTKFKCEKNRLEGSIPDFTNVPKLKYFHCQGNGLVDSIPDFHNLPKLQILYCHWNKLSGNIPDLTTNCPDLTQLWITGNYFTFENILPSLNNLQITTSFNSIFINGHPFVRYENQKKFFQDSTITAVTQDEILVELQIDENITDNIYTWYKDDVLWNTFTGDNNLVINPVNLNESGTYNVEVTNPNAPDLTLYSYDIIINIIEPAQNLQTDSLALIEFYISTGGIEWVYNHNWLTEEPLDTWYGITVTNGRVTDIILPNNNLIGVVPTSINELTALVEFDLGDNSLQSFPNITNMPTLTMLDISNNRLHEIEGLPMTLLGLACEENYLLFDDLEPYQALLTQALSSYSPQTWETEEEYFMRPVASNVVLNSEIGGVNNTYEWFRTDAFDTVISADVNLTLSNLTNIDEGFYQVNISNTTLPNLVFTSLPKQLNTYDNTNSIILDDANNTIQLNTTYSDGVIIIESNMVEVINGADLTLEDNYVYVCNSDAQILVKDSAALSIAHSILRPCHPDSIWQGILVVENGDVEIIQNTEIHNAEVAVMSTSPEPIRVENSTLKNNGMGICLTHPNTAEDGETETISNNHFVISNSISSQLPSPYIGIDLQDHIIGGNESNPGIEWNTFENKSSTACAKYRAIRSKNSGFSIKNNLHRNMYFGIDIHSLRTRSYVNRDKFIHNRVLPRECVATQFTVRDSYEDLQITNLEMYVPPIYTNNDSIFVAFAAKNSSNIVLEYCKFNNFDHNLTFENSTDIIVENNEIIGGAVGAYMDNIIGNFEFNNNEIGGGILCRLVYRLDKSIADNLANNELQGLEFKCNVFKKEETGGGGDHDEDYDMRMFICDDNTMTSECIPASPIDVELPIIENNYSEGSFNFVNELSSTDSISVSGFTTNPGDYMTACNVGNPLLKEENTTTTSPIKNIYPNPTRDWLQIDYESEAELQLLVIDLQGRLIKNLNVTEEERTTSLFVGNLAVGIYYIKIVNGNGEVWNERFVKM